MAHMVNNPHAMQETQAPSLSRKDPLETGMATHFSIFAWRIPWAEKPGRLQSKGHKSLEMTEKLTLFKNRTSLIK